MIKKLSSEFVDTETGIRASVHENGTVTFHNSRNGGFRGNHPNGFVFLNSKKETVLKVLKALNDLVQKVPAEKKIKVRK